MANVTYDILWRDAMMDLLDLMEAENPENPELAPKDDSINDWMILYVKYLQVWLAKLPLVPVLPSRRFFLFRVSLVMSLHCQRLCLLTLGDFYPLCRGLRSEHVFSSRRF